MKRAFINSLIVGAVMFGVAGVCLADFTYANFSSTSGLQLVGTAATSGTSVRLVRDGFSSQIGAAWRTDKQTIVNGFDTTFSFSITNQAGTTFADGLTFVVQNSASGILAAGSDGGGIGYASNEYSSTGIANSLAVEIDLWDNGPSFPDPNSKPLSESNLDLYPHISVQTRGTAVNSPSHLYSLGFVQDTGQYNFKNGSPHTIHLTYEPGTLSIFVDGGATPAIVAPVNFGSLLNLDNGAAFVGFTASAGGGSCSDDLRSWSFTSTPEPATALMLVLGGLMAARRRR